MNLTEIGRRLWSNFLGTVVRDNPEIFGKGFHTGGIVGLRPDEFPAILHRGTPWPFPGHILYQSNPLGEGEAFDLRQRRKPSFHVQISLNPPKTRKRPITDDMVQMCQDLGIEPAKSLTDLFAELRRVQDVTAWSMGNRPMYLEAGLPFKRLHPSQADRWPE